MDDLYPLECDHCGFGDPEPGETVCNDCKTELGRAALTTKVLPTVGDWYVERNARLVPFVKFDNGGVIAEVTDDFLSVEAASNAAILSMAKELYAFALRYAQTDPQSDANQLIELIYERFQGLMQSSPRTPFICKEASCL